MDVLSHHIFHTYQYTLSLVLDSRERYRKNCETKSVYSLILAFAIKIEIGGFKKKNIFLGEQVKSSEMQI